MRKIFITLSCALLFAWASSAQYVTPEFLRQNGGGPWACVKVDDQDGGYKLTNTSNEGGIRIEKVDGKDGKLILLSASDSLFIDGPSQFRIDLPPQSGVALHNKDLATYRKPTTRASMSIPRPLVLNRTQDNRPPFWVFNLAQKDGDNTKVLEKVTVFRDWPSAPPVVTLFFNRKDNPALAKDSVLTVPCDSSIYFSSRQDLVLSKIRIDKAPDGRFIKLDKVVVDGRPGDLILYNPSSSHRAKEDAFSSKYFAETIVNRNINSIKSIEVDYFYLDEDLKAVPVHSVHSIQPSPNAPHRPIKLDKWFVFSCILLGLLLLCALSLMFIAPARNRITISGKKEIDSAPTAPVIPVKAQDTDVVKTEESTTPAKGENDDPAQKIAGLLTTIKGVFGQKKEDETYSQFIERRGKDLISNESASVAVFGRPLEGETYETFFQKIKSEAEADKDALNQLRDAVNQTLGIPKPEESYESLIKSKADRLSNLEDLDRAVIEIFGQPAAEETTIGLFWRSSQSLKEELELEKQNTQQKLDDQKQELEKEHAAAINDALGKLQEVTASATADAKLYRSSQLAILARMQNAYNGCSKYISSGSKFGEYTKHIGISLMSFIELAGSVYKKADEQDSIISLVEKVSPAIQKVLNDHTSWLNALTRLEAYARTEVLRKHMLRDGIQLSALTDLFYAARELLYNNQFTLNPLPDLFVDTDNLDDYNCDNMDIVISNLFDYEEEVQGNAIVDIIKIGYSHQNESVIKTTVAYYSKPEA